MAGGLKFRIWVEEKLYYSENKGADQLRGNGADLRLCFAYAKSRFSHDTAQIYTFWSYCRDIPPKHRVQHRMISEDNFFVFLRLLFCCFVVAICDLVHDVET